MTGLYIPWDYSIHLYWMASTVNSVTKIVAIVAGCLSQLEWFFSIHPPFYDHFNDDMVRFQTNYDVPELPIWDGRKASILAPNQGTSNNWLTNQLWLGSPLAIKKMMVSRATWISLQQRFHIYSGTLEVSGICRKFLLRIESCYDLIILFCSYSNCERKRYKGQGLSGNRRVVLLCTDYQLDQWNLTVRSSHGLISNNR